MKLQIIVPQYKETEEIVRPLLTSIALQQGIDLGEIGVIIVNDGSDVKLSNEFIGSFPFHIDYIIAPHGGVSAARNVGLDFATADYVMFCDDDDMFISACGIYLIFDAIEKGQFDVFVSRFSEELCNKETGKISYINHGIDDATFVHGKVYRRQYLVEKRIRWNPNLTIHEDSYFNFLCRACAKQENIRFCNDVFYLWKYRPDSVCRTDKQWIIKTYVHMIDSTTALTDALLCRGKLNYAARTAANLMIRSYFRTNMDEWNAPENREYKKKNEEELKKFYKKYWPVVEKMDRKEYNELWRTLTNDAMNKGLYTPKMSFNAWQYWMKQ